ncbi:hypothetical protein 2F1_35 [Uncultured Caudovirales phage clone 2F_1]|uniref:Uncharacterized protein n=1 Tax=Uncultured Caudovirales phage clone 2F_1 TaxID=2992576 RepID=A0A2H4JFC0_9CAUD|nr:hypothetical protein [Acinetobacter radioresistens]YP_010092463.1 hypothetical protein KNT73_gp35 [Uncultured Caudovirales phage clone 2F_1]ASN71636.1 hypothetical protein 2F1_35 [Uncultured Caudovirales phage clone 2F_1]RJL74433.1 hypothetical protein D5055_02855 [Acinetobacter radioresistens]
MNDPISIKGLPWLLKIIAAILGAVLALILSGDIDTQGRIKITLGVIIKFTISVAISLYGGSACIEYYQLTKYSITSQGFVMLIFAVFGMLIIGIWYQSLQLMRGKALYEIVAEVKAAFTAMFK